MLPALLLFLATLAGMLIFTKYRTYIALGSAALFLLTGMLPVGRLATAIDWNVLLMISGMMGLVALFIGSRMPVRLAELVLARVGSVQGAAVALALLAGIISAVVDNVATVLMVAPVALAVCKRLETNPVPFLIAIAVSSNLQGAATLVGDTTAILLGSALNLSFADFFWYQGRPSIFFAVELGALCSALILAFLFRKEKKPIPRDGAVTRVTDFVPTVLLGGTIVLLAGASFLPEKPAITSGAICCGMFAIGTLHNFLKTKSAAGAKQALKEIDLQTLGLLLGLFVIIGGIAEQGLIDAAAKFLAKLGGGNLFLLYTCIVVASVVISAFVDNIPFVAAMIPVIGTLAQSMAVDPTALYFGLLSGATLGGNCTPIGASANIAGIGILRRAGCTVTNRDFFRIGIPFTLSAVIPAYLYIWLVFGG